MAIECARRIDYLDSLCRELGLEVKQAGNKLRKDDYVRALRNHFLLEKYGSIDNIPWSMKFMLSIECLQLCRRIQTLKESDQQKVWESDDWIAEEKVDGNRMALLWDADEKQFHFFSRNNSMVDYLPQDYKDTIYITADNFDYDKNFVLDAEVISTSPNIETNDTQCLTQLQSTSALLALNPDDSIAIQRNDPLKFIVFDCLYHDESYMDKPWVERHKQTELLCNILKAYNFNCELNPVIENTEENPDAKREYFEQIINDNREGCFFEDCRVMMADLTQKKIKDIVAGDKVLSYDHNTNSVVESTVTNTFMNGYLNGSNWVTIYPETVVRGRGGRMNERFVCNTYHRIVATKNHKFFNGHDYIPITECDKIYKLNYYLDDYREKALHGWLLSDGMIDRRNQISVSQKIGSYFSFTEELFSEFKNSSKVHISGKGSKIGFFGIRHDVTKHITYSDFNATLINKWLSEIDPITFAYMFMGDGSGRDGAISLAMCSYTTEEVNILVKRLNELGFEDIRIKVDQRVKNGSGAELFFRKETSKKLVQWFGMHVHPSMRYKLSNIECPSYIEPPKLVPTIKSQAVTLNEGINNKSRLNASLARYDIEVDSYHNYFVEGVLVHNCVLKNKYAKYHATSSRTIDCVKVKRSTSDSLTNDIDAFITDYVVGNDDTRNENMVVGFIFSVRLEKEDGTIVNHNIAVCSNISDCIKEDATVIDDNGNVSLNNDYYFRVATLKGQNISARNMRLTHAVIDTWRLDKSADGCEVLKESELKKLIF